MTEQEVINVFKGFKFLPREQKAVDMAVKALEKQIAKEPIKKHRKHGGDTLLCPTCGEDIYTDTGDSYVDYPMNYCDNCGQKIKLGGD